MNINESESRQEIIRNPVGMESCGATVAGVLRRVRLERSIMRSIEAANSWVLMWLYCNCCLISLQMIFYKCYSYIESIETILYFCVFSSIWSRHVNMSLVLFAEDNLFEVDFFSRTVRVVRKVACKTRICFTPRWRKAPDVEPQYTHWRVTCLCLCPSQKIKRGSHQSVVLKPWPKRITAMDHQWWLVLMVVNESRMSQHC